MNTQKDVVDLMDMYGQKVEGHPTISDEKTRLLRATLLFEEVMEFIEATGCFVGVNEDGEFTVFTDPDGKVSLVDMYDAICDIGVVNDGAANAFGLHLAPGREEVQRSNLSKKFPDGTVHKRSDGKVIKPESYSPADLASVVEKLKASKFDLRELLEAE